MRGEIKPFTMVTENNTLPHTFLSPPPFKEEGYSFEFIPSNYKSCRENKFLYFAGTKKFQTTFAVTFVTTLSSIT